MSAAANLPPELCSALAPEPGPEELEIARGIVDDWLRECTPADQYREDPEAFPKLRRIIAREFMRFHEVLDGELVRALEQRAAGYWRRLTVARTAGLCADPKADAEDAAQFADAVLERYRARFPRRRLLVCADDRHVWPCDGGACINCGLPFGEFKAPEVLP